jgi:hypothetical protein
MTATVLRLTPPPPVAATDDESWCDPADLATARYVDREINDARATAGLCLVAATRARAQHRDLLARVLCEIREELTNDATLLAPASLPGVCWPRRASWQIDEEAPLERWLDAIHDSLQHAGRTLRWIADRPDLPPLARAMFAAFATARDARRHLLFACIAIDH